MMGKISAPVILTMSIVERPELRGQESTYDPFLHETLLPPVGEKSVPRRGFFRKVGLLGLGALVGNSAAGNEQLQIQSLRNEIARLKGVIQSKDAGLKEADSDLGVCESGLATTTGEKTALTMELEDTKQGYWVRMQRQAKAIQELQEDDEKQRLRADEQEKRAEKAEEERANAERSLLLTRADNLVLKAALEKSPQDFLKAVELRVKSVPISLTDDAERNLDQVQKTVETTLETAKEWIIPLKEISQRISTVTLPIASVFDSILTITKKYGVTVGRFAIVKTLTSLFDFVEKNIPQRDVKEWARDGANWLRELDPLLKYEQTHNVSVLQGLFNSLLAKIEEIDKGWSGRITDPVLSTVETAVTGEIGRIRGGISDWREDTVGEINNKFQSLEENRKESEGIQATIRSRSTEILAELERRGLQLTPEDVLKIATELYRTEVATKDKK